MQSLARFLPDLATKKYAEIDVKVSWSCSVSLSFFTFSHYFSFFVVGSFAEIVFHLNNFSFFIFYQYSFNYLFMYLFIDWLIRTFSKLTCKKDHDICIFRLFSWRLCVFTAALLEDISKLAALSGCIRQLNEKKHYYWLKENLK